MFTRKLLSGASSRVLAHRLLRTNPAAISRQMSGEAAAPQVTLFLDNKRVVLPFDTEKQTLVQFLSEINGNIEGMEEHFDTVHNTGTGLQLDIHQDMKDIFLATNSIVLSNSGNNKQVVITKPSLGGNNSGNVINPVNHQELINLANELNKRLQDSEVTQQLKTKALDLDRQIAPMHDDLLKIEAATNDTTDHSLLLFLSTWTACTIGIGRLTWWEFSWDIMEPVAWATQAGGMLFWGWYYFITRNENSMSEIAGRIRNKKLLKRLEKQNFDVVKYNDLIERRREVDRQLIKLKSDI